MADKEPGFLGGAPIFNKAGSNVADNEVVPDVPQSLQTYQIRNAVIVCVIVLLFGVLLVMSLHPGGIAQKGGNGGGIDNQAPSVDPDHPN